MTWFASARGLARASVAFALFAGVSGCATMIKGEAQTVSVDTPSVRGARCVFYGDDGYFQDVLTPGKIDLRRNPEDLTVTCTKRGFKDASGMLTSDYNFVTFANMGVGVLFGAPSMLTAFIIDSRSGANYSYQHHIEIPMERLPRTPEPPPATAADSPSAPAS